MRSNFGLILTSLLYLPLGPTGVYAKQTDDQAPILNDPVEAIKDAAKSIGSIFAGLVPTEDSHKLCCDEDCPPGACDVNHMVPTDLGYVYPKPTVPTQKTTSTPTSFPCCESNCIDGACRTKRPPIKQPKIKPAPRIRPPDSLNLIIGCCSTCRGCRSARVPTTGYEKMAKSTGVVAAAVEKAVAPPLSIGICIGCHPCTPCHGAAITDYVEFFASPTSSPGDGEGEEERLVAPKSITATPTPEASSESPSSSSSDDADPTYLLGDDVVSSLNGRNQDTLPIIVQSLNNKNNEPITLLADIDLKLSENYLSQRFVAQLGIESKSTCYPKGLDPSPAVLTPDLKQVRINSTILLDIITGEDNEKLFRNVRFQIHSPQDAAEQNLLNIPDVVLGSKFLREVDALSIYPRFRSSVKKDIKVLYPAHKGHLDKDYFSMGFDVDGDVDESKEKTVKHEEL